MLVHRQKQRCVVPRQNPGGIHSGPKTSRGENSEPLQTSDDRSPSASERTPLIRFSVCLQIFPPPSLPSDYRPVHRFRPSVDVSSLSGVSPALAEALRASRGHMVKDEPQQGGRHQLDSGQRRTLLGEDALQGWKRIMLAPPTG